MARSQPMVVNRSRHACSHDRHASAQIRQWSCMEAWRSHSSPQLLHAVAQASSRLRLMLASYPVCRARTRAVVAQMSAQSRSERMHLVRSATELSLRQESAQAVHVELQATKASITAASLLRSRLISAGYASIMLCVVVVM